MNQRTYWKEILDRGVVASPTRPRKEVKGSLMISVLFSLHPRRELPLAGIISSHNGQRKMRGAQNLPQRHPGTGSGMVRRLVQRRNRCIGKNGMSNHSRGAIRTPFSKVADLRTIPGGSKERGRTGGKQMGRNATGRACLHHSKDLSHCSEADRLFESAAKFRHLDSRYPY
jgi:hypothetical protein